MTHQRRVGGLTVVARELTKARGKLVTRQGVYMWWSRRDHNDFPERHSVTVKNGATRLLFDIDEVIAWYDSYMLFPRQGRRKVSDVFTQHPSSDSLVPGEEGGKEKSDGS